MAKEIDILSVKFNKMSKGELLRQIETRLDNRKRTKIFTPNPQILLRARKEPELFSLLRKADIRIPDGVGLLMAAKRLGTPIAERISGIDLAEDILSIAEKKGLSVFLLGGKKGRANRAARQLKKRFPRLGYAAVTTDILQNTVKKICTCAPLSPRRAQISFSFASAFPRRKNG